MFNNLTIQLKLRFGFGTLKFLFVAWFLYSTGILSWMALNDATPPHCFILKNEKSL